MAFVEESEITLEYLINTLKSAFFDISDIEEDCFTIKIHKYHAIISLNTEQKNIRITETDRLADYQPQLFDKLLAAVNEANSSIINVCSYIMEHKNEEEHIIVLRVDQHISYNKGLIIEQFVQSLRAFEEIDVHIFKNYMMPAVEAFQEEHKEKGQLLN